MTNSLRSMTGIFDQVIAAASLRVVTIVDPVLDQGAGIAPPLTMDG